jgi:hypothetical protein
MGILNYSTTIPTERSIGEITSLLVRKGARSITQEYREDGTVQGVSFVLVVGGMPTRFLLPANERGVGSVMLKENPYNTRRQVASPMAWEQKIRANAERVAWRILKDWVEAQMALIESGQAEAAQVFLPYATEASGRTIYELFIEGNQRRLSAGESEQVA